MTPERLREMVERATPGPWVWDVSEAAVIGMASGAVVVRDTWPEDGPRFDEGYGNAALIALAPELARLCAEQHEWLSHNAPEGHHPTCAIALPQDECDCGYEDAERLLAAFAEWSERR